MSTTSLIDASRLVEDAKFRLVSLLEQFDEYIAAQMDPHKSDISRWIDGLVEAQRDLGEAIRNIASLTLPACG